MRYLELSITQPPEQRHPMHQFIVSHTEYGITRLLHRQPYTEAEHAALFHVKGPVATYRTRLTEMSTILEFEIAPCADDSFYLYIRERLSEYEQEFTNAFSQPGLLVIRPIEYRPDETVRLSAVGSTAAIQAAVDEVETMSGVEVLAVGDYMASHLDSRSKLTPRQFEAISEAVECGYYHEPRDASLETVASRLDCSSGTAGELLRRAERTIMADIVASDSF